MKPGLLTVPHNGPGSTKLHTLCPVTAWACTFYTDTQYRWRIRYTATQLSYTILSCLHNEPFKLKKRYTLSYTRRCYYVQTTVQL